MNSSARRFLQHFLLPLVGGGRVHVGRPLDAGDVEQIVVQRDDLAEQMRWIESIRRRTANALWPLHADVSLDASTVRLAAGVHNLMFCSHPALDPDSSGRAVRRLVAFTRHCLNQGAPRDELELVARHTLLRNLHRLRRTDVDVRFWIGRRQFVGQEPPSRLLRWPKLRGVREERREVYWLGVLSEQQHSLARVLFEQSPLTELLSIPRPFPPIRWEKLVPYLRWPRISRAVCHEYLRLGIDRVGPAIAGSFWRLVDRLTRQRKATGEVTRREGRQALQIVVGLVEYLYASLALTGQASLGVQGEGRGALVGVLLAGRRCGLSQALTTNPARVDNQGRPAGADLCGEVVTASLDDLVRAADEGLGGRAEELVLALERALASGERGSRT